LKAITQGTSSLNQIFRAQIDRLRSNQDLEHAIHNTATPVSYSFPYFSVCNSQPWKLLIEQPIDYENGQAALVLHQGVVTVTDGVLERSVCFSELESSLRPGTLVVAKILPVLSKESSCLVRLSNRFHPVFTLTGLYQL